MANRAAATRKRKQAKAIKGSGSPIKNADPKSSSGRYFLILVLVGLAVAGVMIRVQFLERSLWLDEAWVANSIRAASLRNAIYYDAWLQTTPPLFVALNRVINYWRVACNFLSYPAMLFWPFVVYITFLKDGLQGRTAGMEATLRSLPQSVMVMMLGIFVLLINYLLFIMPNKNAALAEFFGEGFYEGRSFLEFMGFYRAQFCLWRTVFSLPAPAFFGLEQS
jgi:hypothetical protein